MTLASKPVTIKFSPKAGTYTAIMQSPSGDLYQEYEGTNDVVGAIFPDFTQTQPTIVFIPASSRVAEGIAIPTACDFYFNDVLLTFNASGVSTNTFNGETGHFRKLPYAAGTQPYWGVKILKNLVVASGKALCIIKGRATCVYGVHTDTIEATYPIPVRKSTGSPYRVTIGAGDNKYFTITEKGGSCILTALASQKGAELTGTLTYKWFKLQAGSWVELSGKTAKNLTVTDSMVDTFTKFKVEVYLSGTLIGSDVQDVMDATDPYDILVSCSIDEIVNPGDQMVITPILVERGSQIKAMDMTWNFTLIDSVGIVLATASNAATFTATYDQAAQAGGDLGLYIESTQ